MLRVALLLLSLLFLSTTANVAPADAEAAASEGSSSKRKSIGEWEEDIGFYQSIRVTDDSPLLTKQSQYQSIEVHRSDYYGKILVLDGVLQLTERDADSYNEMMAQVPMMQHKNPRRALVIGGGDGYVVSELLKHDSLEHVDHVDLDGEVVEICKQHFSWGAAWEDPRVKLHVADGASFVRDAKSETYDIIVQDSSDPWTWDEDGNVIPLPSGVLYTEEHFQQLVRVLRPDGILNLQAETFHIPTDLQGIVDWRQQALKVGFERASYGSLFISSYPTGQIGFLLCEKDASVASSKEDVESRFAVMQANDRGTTYYQPKLQSSSFDLPLWVERRIYGDDSKLNGVGEEL
mmetsp:Transcript_29908/g.49353  ORF Transcript_29908/g.49353 Transcript_29908/m.49353 type:complete len:348 (+) Transcript_29908:237-1280(+)|eukprot:CAMPEP_0119017658 /NCGR_PEP_ID=MMETSP1176-20130426/17255_1 /TAXON_ID=265551 /ORGANISM="Synedropsis recta cf, Strain CCMP1620" /LENGTH=347 /DNA_ID=CAMNT_0006971443 /DNA_START=222 /DNA_END=1265 /DNA_ORIENTATION=+